MPFNPRRTHDDVVSTGNPSELNLVIQSKGFTASTYAPISSVWEGSDGDLLEAIFKFYPTIPPEPILDSTYNAGRMWKDSMREVVSMDIDPKYNPMIIADNR